MANTINWAGKQTFTAGTEHQYDLNSSWSNYFNATTALVDDATITADGDLSYRIYHEFVGEQQAKAWDPSVWTDLTADIDLSSGSDDKIPQFLYIREWDGANYFVNIYQVFVDTTDPDSITENLGDYSENGAGWSKTKAQVSVDAATDTAADLNSGIATATPGGTDYIYYVSVDNKANWIQLNGSNTPEIDDSGTGANTDVWVKAIDNAGNEIEKQLSLKIDTTDPTIDSILVGGTLGSDGWIKAGSDVTFEFLAADIGGSGVASVSIATWDEENEEWVPVAAAPTDDGGDSQTVGTTYTWTNPAALLNYKGEVQITVTDVAGNVAVDESTSVMIDTTAAVMTIDVNDPAATTWYNGTTGPAAFTIEATDNLSGVNKVQYKIGTGAWTDADYDSENEYWTVEAVDTGTASKDYSFQVIDNAGNVSAASVVTISQDTVNPTISSIAVGGTDGEDGWIKYGSDVTFTFLAKDYSGSGVDSVAIATWDAENEEWVPVATVPTDDGGDSQTDGTLYTWTNATALLNYEGYVQITVTDVAGNVAVDASNSVKIDTTAAVMTIDVNDPAATTWYNIATGPAVFTITAEDNLSGVDKVQYKIGAGAWTDADYDSENECWTVTAVDTGTGAVDYSFQVFDNAGNVSAASVIAIKQDTVAPTASTTAAVHVGNDVTQQISGAYDKWVTDMNMSGYGEFTFSGATDTTAADGGSGPLAVTVSYDVLYQTLNPTTGEWTDTIVNETGVTPDLTFTPATGLWSLDDAVNLPAQSSGRYAITVTTTDAAGNSTVSDVFYVNFDNTQPANPIVTLMDQGAAQAVNYITNGTSKEEGFADFSINADPGVYGGTQVAETAPVERHWWATQTGALNLSGLSFTNYVDEADLSITVDDFNDYWASSVDGEGVVEENSYTIAFFDQNVTGTYSTGASSPTKLSYTRFIVDRSGPVAEQIAISYVGATTEYDDGAHIWYNGSVEATFEAKDKWKGTIDSAGYKDHVSGVASFTINDEEVTAINWQYVTTVEDPGIHSYSYSATDNAGNAAAAVVEDKIYIDTAAPVVGDVFFSDGTENVKQLVKDGSVYVNAEELGEIADFQIVTSVVDVNGETDPEKDNTGVGLDLDVAKSFYKLNTNPNAEFVDAEGKKTAFAGTIADGTYTYVLTYEDHLAHSVTETYTVVIDKTPASIATSGTYTQDGIQAVSPYGPEATANAAAADQFTFGYSSAYDLTFTFADATSGVASWTLTKGEETIKTSEDTGEVVGFTTFNSANAEDLQLVEGENTYTITVLDNAGNETVQDITIRYDVTIDGTVTVKDNNGDEITANGDGKYYVKTALYSLTYAQDDALSGNGNLFTREGSVGDYNLDGFGTETEIVKDITTHSHGDQTTHESYITDLAGNNMALDVTVVVDTAFDSIAVEGDTAITEWQAPTGAPTNAYATNPDTVADGTVDPFIEWTTSMANLVIRVADANLATVTVAYGDADPVEQEVSGTYFDYTITEAMLEQGENVWTIVGTDKAGNSATSTITIKFDNVAPEIGTIEVNGTELPSDRGGADKTIADENPVFVNDISNFTFALNATDAKSLVQAEYYSFSTDFTAWSEWAVIPANFSAAGYYRFAAVDNAGNSVITEKYYLVTTFPGDPMKPVITYTAEDGAVVYTDVDNKGWFNTEITVNALFENHVPGYDQTHYVAKKFDFTAYQAAIAAGEDKADALLAAIHIGEPDVDEYLVATQTTTQEDPFWNWTADADSKAVYYMFSIDEAKNVTIDDFFVQTVLVDTKAPELTLDVNGYAGTWDSETYFTGAWTNGGIRIDTYATDPDSGVKTYDNGYTITEQTVAEGKEYEFKAVDNVGNEITKTVKVFIDTTDPELGDRTDTYDGSWTNAESVTVSYNDAHDDLSGLNEMASVLEQTVTEEGETEVTLVAQDNAGNKVSDTVVVKIDRSGPAIVRTDLYDGSWTNAETVTISATAIDLLSGVDEAASELEFVVNETGSVTLKAVDNVGNVTEEIVQVYIDTMVPTIDVTYNDYTEGTWANKTTHPDGIEVTVAAADEGGSGLDDDPSTTFTVTEDGKHTFTFIATDHAGNEVTKTISVWYDATAPELSLFTHGYESDHWTNQDVSIKVDAFDAASGIAEKSDSQTFTADGEQEVVFYAKDVAGNVTEETVIVKIDKTLPTIEVTNYEEGTWATEAFTLTATAADALSGLATPEEMSAEISEEGTTVVTFEAVDNAGNVFTKNVTVLLDTVAPEVALNLNGYVSDTWTNQDVTISVTAIDVTSGIAAQSSDVFQAADSETADGTVYEFTATDIAGNTAEVQTVVVKIDKTAPVIERTDDYADGTWSNAAVTITAALSDALSGLDESTSETFEYTVESGVELVEIVAKDNAGNEVKQTVLVKVDTEAPEVTLNLNGYVSDTWTNQDVTISVTAIDVISGIAAQSSDVFQAAESETTEGTVYEFTATDVAGNTAEVQTVIVKIDKTLPTIEVTNYEEGTWATEAFTLTATAADALSGLATPEEMSAEISEEGTTVVTFEAVDNAGNVFTKNVTVLLDTVAPEVALNLNGYENNNWTNQDVMINVTATDETSGVASKSGDVFQSAESETAEGTVYEFTATDVAGNTSEVQTVTVKIDKTAPVIERTDDYAEGAWSNTAVTITATASDALSGLATAADLSQEVTAEGKTVVTFVALDNAGNETVKTVKVLVDTVAPELSLFTHGYVSDTWTNQDVSIKVDAMDATSGVASQSDDVTVSEEGEKVLQFSATDVAGNVTEQTVTVKIDRTAPTLELNMNGYEEGSWTNQDVTITVNATDAISGIASKSDDVTVSEEGEKVLQFSATDVAGNETVQSAVVKIDKTGPVIAVDHTPHDMAVSVTVNATFSDALSGIATQEYSLDNSSWQAYTGSITLNQNATLYFRATDKAGNITTTSHVVDNVTVDGKDIDGDGSQGYNLNLTVSGLYTLSGLFGDITGKVKVLNGGKTVFAANLKKGSITSYTKGANPFMVDASKATSFDVQVKEGTNTHYNVELATVDTRFVKADNSDDTYLTAKDLGTISSSGELFTDWVGFGDQYDFRKFTVENSVKLNFDLTATDSSKFKVYQLNGTNLKKLQTVSLKANESKTGKDLWLYGGTYYISMESTNKKAGSSDYTVSLNSSSRFFPAGNTSNNSWATASDMVNNKAEGWVGFGDKADYYRFEISDSGRISLDLDDVTSAAVINKQLKLACRDVNGKSVSLTMFDSDTVASKKDVSAGVYYLGVSTANEKKYDTYYKISAGTLAAV